LNSEDVAYVR